MVPSNVHIYFFANMLSENDVVTDGKAGERFPIGGDTFFLWLDLAPDMKFAHPTRYVFLSAQEVRIKEGNWWPVINGLPHLGNQHAVPSPCTPFDLACPTTEAPKKRAEAHIYPYLLSPSSKLTDGINGKPFALKGDSLLIWISRCLASLFMARAPSWSASCTSSITRGDLGEAATSSSTGEPCTGCWR